MNENQAPQGDWGGLPPILPEPAELVRRARAEGYGFARDGGFYDPETRCGCPAGIAALLAGCPRDEFGYVTSCNIRECLAINPILFLGIVVGFDDQPDALHHREPDDRFDLGVTYGRAVADAAGLPAIRHPATD